MADESIPEKSCVAHVYEILVDGIVRYIGKGTRDRFGDHMREVRHINRKEKVGEKVLRSAFYINLAASVRGGLSVEHRIVASGLLHDEAFAEEVRRIASSPPGQLWNKAKGGNGVSAELLKELWSDPAKVEQHSKLAKDSWAKNPDRRGARFSDPGSIDKQKEMMKQKWQDPEYRAMQKAARSIGKKRQRKGFSERRSALAKARWQDPEFRARAIAGMKQAWLVPGMRERTLNSIAKVKESPEFRDKLRKKTTDRWATPEFRAKMAKIFASPEYKRNMSRAVKKNWSDPVFREKTITAMRNKSKE